jgi:hypothetical protein
MPKTIKVIPIKTTNPPQLQYDAEGELLFLISKSEGIILLLYKDFIKITLLKKPNYYFIKQDYSTFRKS